VGAGSVGLSLGARLTAAGQDVCYVVRRPEQAAALGSGIDLEDPSTGEVLRTTGRARVGIDRAAELEARAFLVCTRASDIPLIAASLGRAAGERAVVSIQNHVDSEAILAEHCAEVVGAVWRQTCTLIGDNQVRALGRARVIVGAYPEGASSEAAWLGSIFRSAGFDVGITTRIMQDKWLKLCINLMSAPNALIDPREHGQPAFVFGKARLIEEARDVLEGAGIEARSCDGRDRSLDEEIAFQRASLLRGTSARKLPVYNQVWREFEMARRRPEAKLVSEAETYHRRICELARETGQSAPLNARVLAAIERAWSLRLGPECYTLSELFGS
jgi:2-dehydropantoate 2-reductase